MMHTNDKLILIIKGDEPSLTENPKESYISILVQENRHTREHPSLEER